MSITFTRYALVWHPEHFPVPLLYLALALASWARETVGGGAEGWGVREADRRRGLWGVEDYIRAMAEGRGIHPA